MTRPETGGKQSRHEEGCVEYELSRYGQLLLNYAR